MSKKERRFHQWLAGVLSDKPCYGPGCDMCPNRCKYYDSWQEQKVQNANRERLSKIDAELFIRQN